MLSGDNGILQRSTDAKIRSGIAEIEEKIDLSVASAMIVGNGELTKNNLETELTKEFGIKGTDWNIDTKTSPWQVTVNSITYGIVTRQVTGATAVGDLDIPSDLVIGSIITWTPKGGTYHWDANYASSFVDNESNDYYEDENTDDFHYVDSNLASGSVYSSLDSEQKINYQDMTISSWKVLSIDRKNNTIEIIPSKSTYSYNEQTDKFSGCVWLHGAQGYNNGVKLLNDACRILYGDEENGIIARSINIDDVEKAIVASGNSTTLATAKTNSSYGNYTLGAYTFNKSYPQLWTQEEGSYLNGTSTGGTLGLSQSPTKNGNTIFMERTNANEDSIKSNNGMVGAQTASTDIRSKQTQYNIEDLSDGYLLPTYSSMMDQDHYYWLASRSVLNDQDHNVFCMQVVEGTSFSGGHMMYDSYDDAGGSWGSGLFPVVTLNSGIISKNGTEYSFSVE